METIRSYFKFLLFFALTYNITGVYAQEKSMWTGFHGSDRQNKSNETGLLNIWPVNGPVLLWTISGLGEGYSSVAIYGGSLYIAGKIENQTYVYAYDLNGKLLWKKPNGEAWTVKVSWASSYNGPRSTPTYDNGIVYHLSEAGKLTAYKSKNGDIIWSRELTKDFKAEIPMYGYTESVLVDGNNLFVRPAGQKGFQVCLNKLTGEIIWTNTEIPGDYGYNSGIVKDFGGYHQIIGASSSCFYSIDTKTGKLLWKVDFENSYKLNCADAVTFNEYVILSSGEGKGSMLVKLKSSGKSITAEKVWQTELMDNYHGGFIFHNGYVYGAGSSTRSWFCIDILTGKQMWKTQGSGSLTFADGMLYLYDEKGTMKLVKASPEKFEKVSEFIVPKGGEGPYWAHPVVCGGRLYLRHADKLFAYNISSK
jgi:outer membrane protein assembly factor BamB